MSDKAIKVLVVEPQKPCYIQEISGLKAMQELVGGHIEAVYPFDESVAVVCNEDGKNLGLPCNRPLRDVHGKVYDILCGTFFVAGLGEEDFTSLTEPQIQRYRALYDKEVIRTKKPKNRER